MIEKILPQAEGLLVLKEDGTFNDSIQFFMLTFAAAQDDIIFQFFMISWNSKDT